ncbi:MAG: ABC transporter permease/substrate-binding protein [Clostridium sp.]|nr:ABC transporter permease/substrate-binding protein [Clostridium sp.]
MSGLMNYLSQQYAYVGSLLLSHIRLAILSVAAAIIIGIPLGIFIADRIKVQKPVLGVANIVQAIPSLAILGFLVPYMGIGANTAVFMVVLYSLLPILKNTCAGLGNINQDMIEAARGIGMTNRQILFKVKLPLALPVIMAGIRISSVTAVGLMTIAAYIGAGGLGTLVISGIQTDNSSMILAGAIPACLLALLMDFVMARVEKAVTPIALRLASSELTPEREKKEKRQRKVTLAGTSALILAAVVMVAAQHFAARPDIRIGSKEACESVIIGNMMADLIEAKTDLKVERKLALGGTMIAFDALSQGEIDLYPEYTGTIYSTVLGNPAEPGLTKEKAYEAVSDQLKEGYDVDTLTNFGFSNTYVLAVSKETAEKYHLEKVSDLINVNGQLRFGCSPEFAVRDDGLPGIEKTYGLKFKSIHNFSGTLMYTAINSKEVDVITAFSTDGLLQKYDLTLLEDDRHFFPPYFMLPIVNGDTMKKYPELNTALESMYNAIDDETMQSLNYRVVELGEDRAKVARDFLLEKGFVTEEELN